MGAYHSKDVQNTEYLPTLDWNLFFLGGYLKHAEKNWHMNNDRHLGFELIQIMSGAGIIRLNQHRFDLTSNDILIIPPNTDHKISCTSNMIYFDFKFSIDNQQFTSQLMENGLIYYPRDTPANDQLIPVLHSLCRLIRSNMKYDFTSKLYIQKYFTDFLIVLYQQTLVHKKATSLTKIKYAGLIVSSLRQELKKQIDNFILNGVDPRLNNPITVKKVIIANGISVSYGTEVFKDIYGISPRAYLSHLKLNEAKRLLLIPDYSIADISTALGYNEQSHFARQFKRWSKMTPNQFRNQQK